MTFETFARAHGLVLDRAYADARVHRVPTTDHQRKKNGAYWWDGRRGWVQAWDAHDAVQWYHADRTDPRVRPLTPEQQDALAKKAREQIARRQAQAAATAQRMLSEAELLVPRQARHWREENVLTHPYLQRKGLSEARCLMREGVLLVPMHDCKSGRLVGMQTIAEGGEKKFLAGQRARGAIHRIGRGPELWLCEGYATGLTIDAALQRMYRQASVVVTFSAGNLSYVAGLLAGARYVVADHDASGAGEAAARATGLPWGMSDRVGEDANDLMQRAGRDAVRELLRRVLAS